MKLGTILKEQNLITQEQLETALSIQENTNSPLGKILAGKGYIKHFQLDQALAKQFNLDFREIEQADCNVDKITKHKIEDYLPNEYIELLDGTIAISNPRSEQIEFIRNKFGQDVEIVVSSKENIMLLYHQIFRNKLSHDSVYALAESYPGFSAGEVFINKQLISLYIFLSISLFALFYATTPTVLAVNIVITAFLVISFIFKFALAWMGSSQEIEKKVTTEEVDAVEDDLLPMYSVLVPMYNEPEVLPIIVNSLRNLDYPKEKLDIKLVLEEKDFPTINAAKELDLEDIFEICLVPHSMPKTKPKACNYALRFVRGEYVTIYDAEDKPERDQLKKALVTFKKSPENTAVVQARLNYYNDKENFLTRCFTLEYSLWFDFFLPALEILNVPIPLGGTSNHFKTSILQAVGGWDPFNVTEDADLGIRYSQLNYVVRVVNSTTYEEANTSITNWVRQRSRWLKGYMQTYLVHMRAPIKLYRSIGFKGFFSFQFFIGMTILTALVTPWLYGMFFFWLYTKTSSFDPYFTESILYLSNLNLLLGNSFYVYIMMLGVTKRSKFYLIPFALIVPFYWILMSIAGYKGLYQLFVNPFYWEKTQHGLSAVTKAEAQKLA